MVLSLWAALHKLCKGLGIIHQYITVGNSKANRQARMDDQDAQGLYPLHGLTKMPATFGTNHLALAATPVMHDSE